ncbi:flagellar brake domain-containing protein [Bacillus sp. R1-10]
MLEPKYTPQKEKFNCMVVEMVTGCFYMDFPIDVETGKIAFLMDGTQFNVTFSNEEQVVYVFESEVLGKVKGRIPMMQLLLPEAETFVKIQRRQFEFTPFRPLTEDISTGGASIRLLKALQFNRFRNYTFGWRLC